MTIFKNNGRNWEWTLLDGYVHYYNNQRLQPLWATKSPVQYKTELGF